MIYRYLTPFALPLMLFSLLLGGCDKVQPTNPSVSEKVPPKGSSTSDEMERGLEALNKGDNDLAIFHFDAAIRINPKDAAVYLHRGLAYSRKRDLEKAIKDYAEAIRLDPKDATAYLRRGLAYDGMRESDKAVVDYTEAIRLNPDYTKAYILRAVSFAKKRKNDKAIQDCTQAIRLDPKNPSAYTMRGVAYADEREYEKAIADYSEALRCNPNYSLAYNKLAWLWATCPRDKLRNVEKALECARKACELSDWEDAHNLESLAAAYAENGQFGEAVKWQKKALANQEYDKQEAEEARIRLKPYEEKKPYRELDRPRGPQP